MAVIDEWIAATHKFATALATQAHSLASVPPRDVASLRAFGQSLLETVISGLPLLSPCEVVNVVQKFDVVASKIDSSAAERLSPVRGLTNQVMSLTHGGLGPIVWAQERNGLPELLRDVPLPDRERRVIDNMLWTRDMFDGATKALEGVGEEIERQDGSGERKAKEAARELEKTAQNPPAKQTFLQRVAAAIGSVFRAVFG